MYNNEVEITQNLIDRMNLVKKLMKDLTDLSDHKQAKDMRNALWGTMLEIEGVRNLRNVNYYKKRVEPGATLLSNLRNFKEGA